MLRPRRSAVITVGCLAAGALLLPASGTLAASPKANASFHGTVGAGRFATNKVSFKVSHNSSKLTGFKFQTFGCEGGGGPLGVPYFMVGSISVRSTGNFSSATVRHFLLATPTKVQVSGKFTSAKKVKGTIKISQTFPARLHIPGNACHGSVPFRATTH